MTYKVQIYQEIYTDLGITAKNQEEAERKALAGQYTEDAVLDVTIKESEVLETTEIL